MKQKLLLVISLPLLLYSCQFSKGVKKDLSTGLTASYNGFSVDDVFLSDVDKNRLNTNKVSLGSTVLIVATGVKNYVQKNGRVFPGCTIILSDKDKKQLLHIADAFSDRTEGIPASEAGVLQAELNTGKPMFPGETYRLAVRFFDKNKPENEIVATVDVLAEK